MNPVNAGDIVKALRKRYPLPEWASFGELRDGTGVMALRSVDFWAMNCFPSKGFLTVAVEIKVTRSDFFRELDNPTKRASAEAYSREAYFATPVGLIKPEELPSGWGLLEVTATGVARVKVRAPQRERPSFDEAFIASVLRRVGEIENEHGTLEARRDELRAAVSDMASHLDKREAEYFEGVRPKYEAEARRKVEAEIMGEGFNDVAYWLRKEFPYKYGTTSTAALVLELVKRASENRLERIGVDGVKHTVRESLAALKRLAQELNIE